MLLFYLFVFIFGLAIGSFLNVVIYRLENGEDMVRDRSHCMDCKHILAWYDLVPVFSFLALGGKCRYCGKALSIQYPMVELGTALLFVLVIWILNFKFVSDFGFRISDLLAILYYLFIASALIVIFVYDLKHYIIPDKVVYSAIAISLAYTVYPTLISIFSFLLSSNFQFSIFNSQIFNLSFFNGLLAAFLASGFFLAMVLITRGAGMGGGDVKLAFLMGLVLGWPKILLALFAAFTLGAICGIILMIFKKKNFKSEIPFGPFLVIGTMIAMFWGRAIIERYSFFLY